MSLIYVHVFHIFQSTSRTTLNTQTKIQSCHAVPKLSLGRITREALGLIGWQVGGVFFPEGAAWGLRRSHGGKMRERERERHGQVGKKETRCESERR